MGKMTWTAADIERLRNKGLIINDSDSIKPKPAKYGNKKRVVNGIEFDSIKEANRYKHLLLLLKTGIIGLLELQVPFELNQGGTHSLKYIADFVYYDQKTGEKIVEDAKGFKTATYLKKRKLMLKVHGIQIKES